MCDGGRGWPGRGHLSHPCLAPRRAGALAALREPHWAPSASDTHVAPRRRLAQRGGSFFSPWFGIESSDNLDLIQPVNPWTGSGWEIYNEVFEWSPEHNFNSEAHGVRAGDTVYGRVTFAPENHTYTMYHSSLADGWSVTNSIPIQRTRAGPPVRVTAATVPLTPARRHDLQRLRTAATRSLPWRTL